MLGAVIPGYLVVPCTVVAGTSLFITWLAALLFAKTTNSLYNFLVINCAGLICGHYCMKR